MQCTSANLSGLRSSDADKQESDLTSTKECVNYKGKDMFYEK